ncbi:pro-opiomelanocortin-like [Melanotaenia boesemani]|uniref:pro-opiomelanocortin-like n=1 Tax=Melanotaenia boesemani TaxID=1250792 RepID=UPI001C03F5B9|nr:pro-opiomelanocortin-like [Melanotaenia boesemani]
MVCLCWLSMVVMAFMCIPGFGLMCLDSSICNNLSSEDRILDCVHFCFSAIQTEFPQLSASAQHINDEDNNLLLSVVLATLASEDKISKEFDLKAHSDKRRSYSMEHFRWGKPSGRKRRPVKVFASSLEGGDYTESSFPFKAKRSIQQGSDQNEGLLRPRVSSRSHSQVSQQDRKDGTYRMTHFRWGSPPASKRNGSFMKPWEEKPQGPLSKFLKNIIMKDVQRIMG